MYVHFSVAAALRRSCMNKSYSTGIKTRPQFLLLQCNKRSSRCLWHYESCRTKSDCTCLPPPCNTPPRCIQYMTGYYYYPYGTWFCGPYHVAGSCPVGAKGPCPCPKCCVACICPAPNTDPTKAGTPIEKCTLKAESFPAVMHCQTTSKLEENKEQNDRSKLLNFDENEKDSESEQKNVPPVLASMIQPNSHRSKVAMGAGIQSSYTVSHSKSDSKP
ncbi:unnamed protein product [Euphydryas editha]|uniref:Uncharacterized protein n=1 Tax=Euphydryas editha TaxID=104508 RepID=A0AAU9UQ65_EUPED|nr:unnamed protein product [Euphydryas editha]